MDIATIEKRARSQAINLTISMVDDALKLELELEFPPYATPSDRRKIMVARLVAEFGDATAKIAMLERTVADLRVAAAKQEDVIGWGSRVRLKRDKKKPVWVEFVPGGFNKDDAGWITMTPEFERTVDEVAGHLRNGRLVDWGGKGWRDEYIRRIMLQLNKAYRKQYPSFRRKDKWNVQPPTRWNVFYVLGMEDLEDPHTMRRVSKAMKAGKRIIDITGNAPVDLTDAYQWVVDKIVSGRLRWA